MRKPCHHSSLFIVILTDGVIVIVDDVIVTILIVSDTKSWRALIFALLSLMDFDPSGHSRTVSGWMILICNNLQDKESQ